MRLLNGTQDIVGNEEFNAIRQAFNIWENNANLIFFEVNPSSNPDIEISWVIGNHSNHQFCGSNGFHCPFSGQNGVLAHVVDRPPPGFFFENNPLCGDIHFDESENWSVNIQSHPNQPIDLITVAAHEIGHSLGLAHSSESGALMFGTYNGSRRFLHEDDISSINELYPNPIKFPTLSSINSICSGSTQTVFVRNRGNLTTTWTSSSNVQISSSNHSSARLQAIGGHSPNAWVKATFSNGMELTRRFGIKSPPTIEFANTSLTEVPILMS